MDIAGARSGRAGAEAILKLRSLNVSGDLAAYVAFHFAQEQQPNYPKSRTHLSSPASGLLRRRVREVPNNGELRNN
jgi:hypothetical protein